MCTGRPAPAARWPSVATVSYTTIDLQIEDGTAVIWLDRPEKLNAFNGAMVTDLLDAFERTDNDDDVRVVIVTGRGRGFCAGADLSGGARTFDYGRATLAGRAPRDTGGLVALRIFRSTKPVIAAINGPAVGIGATMTLPMDIRLMAEGARMGFVFGARGIVPDAASSWFLPRLVGVSRALEWCLTARLLPAAEVFEAGLVRSVHPDTEVLAAARALAGEIATSVAPVSASITRQMMWRMLGASHPMEAHRVDSLAIWKTGRLADSAEGIDAFMLKRPARWGLRPSVDTPEWDPWWVEPPYEA